MAKVRVIILEIWEKSRDIMVGKLLEIFALTREVVFEKLLTDHAVGDTAISVLYYLWLAKGSIDEPVP